MIVIFDELAKELGLDPSEKNERFFLFDKTIELDNLSKAILVTGGEDSGKTVLSLSTIKNNSDKTFLYIDTLCSLNKAPTDNSLLLLGNDIFYIMEFIKELDRNILDCVIIDGISHITSEEDDWGCENLRYEVVQKHICTLLTLCASKNIMLIAINTFNAKGTSSNISNKLKQQFQIQAELKEPAINIDNSTIRINVDIIRDSLCNFKLEKKEILIDVPRDDI